jgi:hypothetical protein
MICLSCGARRAGPEDRKRRSISAEHQRLWQVPDVGDLLPAGADSLVHPNDHQLGSIVKRDNVADVDRFHTLNDSKNLAPPLGRHTVRATYAPCSTVANRDLDCSICHDSRDYRKTLLGSRICLAAARRHAEQAALDGVRKVLDA